MLRSIKLADEDCDSYTAELFDAREIERPQPYSLEGLQHSYVRAKFGVHEAEGWGSGVGCLAEEKAKSEALERLVFLISAADTGSTSNGWAAHTDWELARAAAVSELVEREVALRTWFNRGVYSTIPKALWPAQVLTWNDANAAQAEFGKLVVFLSESNSLCCVSAFLSSDQGATVVGHASGKDLSESILSAFNEASRSVHGVLRFDDIDQVMSLHSEASREFGPGANAYAYAYGEPMPQLIIKLATAEAILAAWQQHQKHLERKIASATLTTFKINDRFVVKAECPDFLKMFWGRTDLNLRVKNQHPHIVG